MAQKKELTKTQKLIALVTVIALAAYSVISIALAASAYGNLNTNVDELADVIANWQTGSILDMKVAENCGTDFQPAFNDRSWSGVSSGCWCGTVSASKLSQKNITCSPFCSGVCSADATDVGCKSIAGKSSQVLNYVGTDASSKKLQLCIKRTSENWADVAFISASAGDCPSGYKTCGKGDNKFCTKQSMCPITSITLNTLSAGTAAASILACGTSKDADGNPKCAVLANDAGASNYRTITWTRSDLDALPLSQMTLNEYSMCRLSGTTNSDPTRSYFYLYNEPSSCGLEGMTKWKSPGTIKESDLFKANDLTTYISGLSTYTQTGMQNGYYPTGKSGADFNYGVFTREYIPFKASCRERLQSLISKKDFVEGVRSAQLALLIISIVSVVFLGIPLAYLEVQNLRGEDIKCIEGKGEEERARIKKIKKIIGYVFKLAQLPFQAWAIHYSSQARGLLLELSTEDCSNYDTNIVLIFIATTLNKTYTSTITSIAILVASLVLDIILDILDRRKAKKEAEKAKANKANAVSPSDERMELANIDNSQSVSPVKYGSPTTNRTSVPAQNQTQQQVQQPQVQPQTQQQGPSIVIQIQPGQLQQQPQPQYPQQQYPPQQQQYPPQQQQYPPQQQQYPPQQQQYPPQQQQYPPQQYPPQQQGYPQQQQYPPQQYPPQQQGYPQQQYPPRY